MASLDDPTWTDAQPRDFGDTVESSLPLTPTQYEPTPEKGNVSPQKTSNAPEIEQAGMQAAQQPTPAGAATQQDSPPKEAAKPAVPAQAPVNPLLTAPVTPPLEPKASPASGPADPSQALGGVGAPAKADPPSLKVIYKRMDRIMQPTAKGTFKVGEDLRKQWQDIKGGGRDKILSMFAQCNHEPDGVCFIIIFNALCS